MLDFSVNAAFGDVEVTEEELKSVLLAPDRLVRFKGKWVEVDRKRIAAVLDRMRSLREGEYASGIPLQEALRRVAGYCTDDAPDVGGEEDGAGFRTTPGAWLGEVLGALRDPARIGDGATAAGLKTTLRPYQQVGVEWLWFMSRLGLGACLADDMGLGKTIQVLAFLLRHHRKGKEREDDSAGLAPSLLVVPASLIANWLEEVRRHAPALAVICVHPDETTRGELEALAAAPASGLAAFDLVITTYGMVPRLSWLRDMSWSAVILDEAQAIKNPGSLQAKAVKELPTRVRLALTGTPVENRLADLWSLFDFLNPGLLGSARQFNRFIKSRAGRDKSESSGLVGPVRALTRPYILRRVKTDKGSSTIFPTRSRRTRSACSAAARRNSIGRPSPG